MVPVAINVMIDKILSGSFPIHHNHIVKTIDFVLKKIFSHSSG
jgi:hypothetical protein